MTGSEINDDSIRGGAGHRLHCSFFGLSVSGFSQLWINGFSFRIPATASVCSYRRGKPSGQRQQTLPAGDVP